ncbi:hypothetical protein P4C99_19945 [Pontiellaceae bacterium B1224]|nr:hypothetical protein [Pontiellaceae bacterium B1224]
MFKVRTFCLALLIPLLLDLLVFFAALPTRADSLVQIKRSSEEVQTGCRELEVRSEEEEEEEDFSFGGLPASSQRYQSSFDFRRLECAVSQSFFLPARSFGWKMPLRI